MTESPQLDKLTVYGAYGCPACRRSKQFLGEHQIPYNGVDIEQDKAGAGATAARLTREYFKKV
jgi:glutaredoxin